MTIVWVDDKRWDLDWVGHEALGQGGQGITKRVERKATNEVGCLKLLSKQTDVERRLRFAREATAYDTCSHPLIPRLLASNAQRHSDLESKLFLVTEFIPGPTLSKRIEFGGSLGWKDAHQLTRQLLITIEYLHHSDWVHRDIKPDNIVLRSGSVSEPVLLDFGLSYKDGIVESLETEHGQEIGNRFLRLPELSAGSTAKRDERSDLAFVGGVLFYALTGMIPATLQDSAGNMPHQRKPAADLLSLAAGAMSPQLFDFFDRCFNPLLQRRHSTASSMLAALDKVLAQKAAIGEGAGDDLSFIKSHLARDRVVELQQLAASCISVYRVIDRVVSSICAELNGQFVRTQGGMKQNGASVHTNLGFAQSDNHELRFSPRWEIDVQGSEIVVSSSSGFLFRLDAIGPDPNVEFTSGLRSHFLKGIRGLIEAPTQQVVHRGFFRAIPFSTLADALVEAKRRDRPVFAVVYDQSSSTLSKLDNALGYFMEYASTKDLVDGNFVVALVATTEATHLVTSSPLELARWFLLDKNGSILDQRDVYANPDEGLNTVRRLVSSNGKRS